MNRTARVRVRWQAPEPSRQLLQALAEDRMVIVGDDEASRRVAAVKALRGVEAAQREVSFDELAAELGRELQAKPA